MEIEVFADQINEFIFVKDHKFRIKLTTIISVVLKRPDP